MKLEKRARKREAKMKEGANVEITCFKWFFDYILNKLGFMCAAGLKHNG